VVPGDAAHPAVEEELDTDGVGAPADEVATVAPVRDRIVGGSADDEAVDEEVLSARPERGLVDERGEVDDVRGEAAVQDEPVFRWLVVEDELDPRQAAVRPPRLAWLGVALDAPSLGRDRRARPSADGRAMHRG
jgi:hypothetical protein